MVDLTVGEQEEEGLGEEVEPSEAHDRVEGEMLVADKNPSEGIEVEFAVVEAGSEGREEGRGNDEEGEVLKVGVEVQAVAGNVVSVVVPFPPSDADAGQDVAGEDLDEPVQAARGHHVVVPGVVADPAALDPGEADEGGGEEVDGGAVREEDAGDGEGEEGEDEGEEGERGVALAVEEAGAGELGEEAAVVGGGGGDGVVAEAEAGGEAREEGGG